MIGTQYIEECFAYDDVTAGCNALSERLCRIKKTCPFYKTRQQYKEDLKKYGNAGGVLYDDNGLKHPEYSKRT